MMDHSASLRLRGAPVARLLLAGALMTACNGTCGPGGLWDVPEATRQSILPWLLCTDCTDGELASVLNAGTRAVPYLSAALLEGPTHLEDSLARSRAVEAVVRVSAYRQRRSIGILSQSDSLNMVQAQHDAFLLKYRLRAAQALQRIDPDRAGEDVGRWCRSRPPELERNPPYKASFKGIGVCP